MRSGWKTSLNVFAGSNLHDFANDKNTDINNSAKNNGKKHLILHRYQEKLSKSSDGSTKDYNNVLESHNEKDRERKFDASLEISKDKGRQNNVSEGDIETDGVSPKRDEGKRNFLLL